MLGKLRLDCGWLANQHYANIQFACSQHTSFNLGTGRIVPSHRIHGNCDHGGVLPFLPGQGCFKRMIPSMVPTIPELKKKCMQLNQQSKRKPL
jgi:hypothetical protein